jgi:hypothetical protein
MKTEGENNFVCEKGNKSKLKRLLRRQINPIIIIIIVVVVSCHRLFLPGTSLEPAVTPTTQASSFTLQYFPYYV